uniref:Multiple inositol polyphosphate phosphatase 1 n=1 Tax=Globisporangium ultimum (strain ATCC 200006 / CBS 805.95 / DAOM BR144) TaxID=431595 RepID=K3WU79_GLOUD
MRAIATLLTLLLTAVTPSCALQGGGETTQQRVRDDVLHAHMSTKTKYPTPTRDEELTMQQTEHARATALQCEPIHVNFVIRHGTRYPTIKDITRIAKTHAKLRGDAMSGEDEERAAVAEWITTWKNPYRADEAGWLAPVGVTELIAIGNRIRHRFGEHFGSHFDPARFEFEHTWKPRTQQSASAFAFGFFRSQLQPVFMHVDAIGEDHELRFFDNCPAYDHAIDRNATATLQHAEYRQSAQMRANLRRFRALARNPTLTQKDLEAAYAACAFDVSVWNILNEWCELFNADMLHSMDYFHDLKHFYKKSHGHALAFEIAAPLLQDMFRSMKERIDGQSVLEGHFRFAHAETILPLASLLNVSYFDRHASDAEGHFLSSTPLELAKTRTFQAAKLAPFAANIGFVLYECAGDSPDSVTKTYRIATLLNERHVTFRECDDELLCPFDRMQTIFRRWIHEYDFHEQCHV